MRALATRPVEEVLAEARQKREEILAAAKAADADVKRLEDEICEIRRPYDEHVADLNHDLRKAATQHKRSAEDLAEAGAEVEFFSIPQYYPQIRSSGGRYRRPVMSIRNESAQEKKTRETRLASAKKWHQQAQATLDQAKQEMTDLKSQREQAAADYRHAMQEKRPLLTDARKKSRELAERARDVEHLSLTPEKIKSRVTDLETYVPLDPETEKSRLLATLKSTGC